MANSPPASIVISFPPSIGNELGLWLLDHYQVDYQLLPYSLVFIGPALWWKTRQSGLPTFKSDSVTLAGPKPIVYLFESQCAAGNRLLPKDDDLCQQVWATWPNYFDTLGNAVAIWSYYNLLPNKSVMIGPLTWGVSSLERWVVQLLYPLLRSNLTKTLGLSAQTAEASMLTIRQTFQQVADRLSDGRPYLFGSSMTLADLCFAANAAPIVIPPEGYGGPPAPGSLPTFENLPESMKPFVSEMRQHPAGLFALRMYHQHRQRVPVANR